MPVSKAKQASVNQSVRGNYDRIHVTAPKGQKEETKARAESRGERTNALINRAIVQQIEQDSTEEGD